MSKRHGPSGLYPDIATQAELLARLRARAKPAPAAQLTPSGGPSLDIRRQVNEMANMRIQFLRIRLDEARNGFENEHTRAMVRGTAKREFGIDRK